MESIRITSRELMIYGTILNAIIGLILGLIPLLFGYFNRRLKTGAIGFAIAVFGGAILGVLISIPATIIFTWLVVRKSPTPEPEQAKADDSDGL